MPETTRRYSSNLALPSGLVDLLDENRTVAADPQALSPAELIARYYVEAWIREELEEHPENLEWISLQARAILAHPNDPAAGRLRFIPEMLADMDPNLDRPDPPKVNPD